MKCVIILFDIEFYNVGAPCAAQMCLSCPASICGLMHITTIEHSTYYYYYPLKYPQCTINVFPRHFCVKYYTYSVFPLLDSISSEVCGH